MSIEAIPSKASATEPRQRTATARRAVICAFAATGGLATNIFLPSLPAIAADLRVSSAAVTSSITVFLAIFAVGQLIVGPVSDRLGRQMPILIGLCIFVQGTIWCALAGDLLGLLIGRSIQAAGACAVAVLSRAIARDLFDGQALGKVMASITIATAAAPGFSPLVGSALDQLFGWRYEFAFVAVFAICAGAAYVVFVGETKAAAENSLHPLKIASCYLGLIRDARFAAPARTASLLMAGVFAVFSGAPRVLLEGFGLSPITIGSLFASVVVLVFGAGMLAPRLSARFGSRLATLAGLALAAIGALLLLAVVLTGNDALLPFLATASLFLFGMGIASPLSSAAALSPFGDRAGLAAALFGFSQMAGAACGVSLAAILSSDPAIGLGAVLALTSLVALVLHGWEGQLKQSHLQL
ncbi:DHA1 family bicyclomycin/chloramphenicol resistance-like MFS transporter [Bradyrhizobium sp. AZCC 1719]|uniref:Bcr/CflA family efflux MFS transporter n=1 Tax=Bradyrhizobium sp. AZCC 1719 TaxID=3117028 RepID=UPI002FF037DC